MWASNPDDGIPGKGALIIILHLRSLFDVREYLARNNSSSR
jgi:hypothetical protein